MVVGQLSTQRLCARTTCTLMPLLLLSPEPKWLSSTLNSASPCAPRPSLSASARRPFVDGSPAPNRPASPSACTIIPQGLFPSLARPAPNSKPRSSLCAANAAPTLRSGWFSPSPRPHSPASCAAIISTASLLWNLPNLRLCATNATPQATSFTSTSRSSAAFIAQASAPLVTALIATQAPASSPCTSPSTTTPASPSLVCSQTNGLPAPSTLCSKPSASTPLTVSKSNRSSPIAAPPIAPSPSHPPAINSASNISSPNPIAPKPTARPNASSRPSPASGPMPGPTTPVTTALPPFLTTFMTITSIALIPPYTLYLPPPDSQKLRTTCRGTTVRSAAAVLTAHANECTPGPWE